VAGCARGSLRRVADDSTGRRVAVWARRQWPPQPRGPRATRPLLGIAVPARRLLRSSPPA